MERFIKGDVVVIDYPFSDLSGAKRRPALILARVSTSDFLLCAITSLRITENSNNGSHQNKIKLNSFPPHHRDYLAPYQ